MINFNLIYLSLSRKFAKNHPNVVKIMTEVSKGDADNETPDNIEQHSSITNTDEDAENNNNQLSLFSPRKIIM